MMGGMTGTDHAASVLISDDSGVVRERLAALLREVPGVSTIVEAVDVDSTLEQLRVLRPPVMVLDLGMPGGGGFEVLRKMQTERLQTAVIVLTNYHYPEYEKEARNRGAIAFLNKSTDFLKAADMVSHLLEAQQNRARVINEKDPGSYPRPIR
jgi:DNA-binding NarL/FixJ family response regulator